LESIDKRLGSLSPEELNQFVDSLSPQDLKEWSRRISSSGGFLFHQDGLSSEDTVALINLLRDRLGPEQLAKLSLYIPGLRADSSRTERRVRSDRVFRREPGAGGDTQDYYANDWAGRSILERYLEGGPDWTIVNDRDWTDYMTRDTMLRQELQPRVSKIATDA
jgi:hypothetical protein